MAEPVVLLSAAAVNAVLGFGWLALAMDTHWEQVHGEAAPTAATVRNLRAAGVLALALSLGLCLQADHPSMAALVWLMLLAGSAAAIAATLSWRPRWLKALWPR
ncbi:DUF3325 domain-containing protein [Roseateles sp. UC29_93]|uniref:DUF3325 domain-containing protein n=1 Tax=Roseateles TaxID=93681 RepID=UPI0036734B31